MPQPGAPMAVHFTSEEPQALLHDFDARITQSDSTGRITTWEKTSNGRHYTHRAAEWTRKAWFKADVKEGCLTFFIVKSRDLDMSTRTYAYYHGHLIETFLAHFDSRFAAATASALPEAGDIV
jgi:hypothetical protein